MVEEQAAQARSNNRAGPGAQFDNEEDEKHDDIHRHAFGFQHNMPIINDFGGDAGNVVWRLRKFVKKAQLTHALAGQGVQRDHKTAKDFFKVLNTI